MIGWLIVFTNCEKLQLTMTIKTKIFFDHILNFNTCFNLVTHEFYILIIYLFLC